MSKEQILKSIERAEHALSRKDGLTEGAKASLQKQVTQMKSDLAALEAETVKKEEKIEKKEKEATEDLDAEIAKCEAILKRSPGAKIKEVFEKKLKVFFGPINETIPMTNDMFAMIRKLLSRKSITLIIKHAILIMIRATPIFVSLSFRNIFIPLL